MITVTLILRFRLIFSYYLVTPAYFTKF